MFTILKFSTTHCIPCRNLANYLESNPFDKANIISIDCEENDDLVEKYRICNVPTVLLFNTGDRNVTDPQELDNLVPIGKWIGTTTPKSLMDSIANKIDSYS